MSVDISYIDRKNFDFVEHHSVRYDNSTNVNEEILKTKKNYFDQCSTNFMNNFKWHQALVNIIDNIETSIKQQSELENIYKHIINTITAEMEAHLKFKDCTKKSKQKYKHAKPYWSEKLTLLWKEMSKKERVYIKCKGTYSVKQNLKDEFLLARSKFDKALRYAERQYNKKFLNNLETVNTSNPKEFWTKIKHLGPRKQPIPFEVEINGERCSDKNIVLEKWASEFENLLNGNQDDVNPHDDYHEIIEQMPQRELNINENNAFLNQNITHDEVRYHIHKCKNNKSPGLDNIPYEVLKCEDVTFLLFKLFDFCFKNNVVPSDWSKAIITPIPKGSSKNPYLPLSYRGISLLPCISKIYTSILNSRINFFS